MASVTKTRTATGESRYRVRYRDPSGASREKWFRRKVDAYRYARNVETDVDRGEWVDPERGRMPYREWAERWMAGLGAKKPKTLSSYRELLDTLVLPILGGRTLAGIRPGDIKALMGGLQERGLSASRRRQAFWVISGSLRAAVEDGRIGKNPADAARKDALPKPGKVREPRFLSIDEVWRLAAEVGPEHAPLILTLSFGGLRSGEALALRRRRIDLLHRRLHIAENLSEVEGVLHFVTPKSGRERWVSIPAIVADVLEGHLDARVGEGLDDLVFTGPEGGPLRLSNFRHRIWNPAIEALALTPRPSIHDLRHTAASLLVDEGANLEMVRSHLGHSTITLTQRYTHLYPASSDAVVERLGRRLENAARGAGVGLAPEAPRRSPPETTKPPAAQGVSAVVRDGVDPSTSGFSDRRSAN